MAEKGDIQNTMRGVTLGKGGDDLLDGDLSRGYWNASPDAPGYEENVPAGAVDHPLGREPDLVRDDEFRSTHGRYDEYGFVKRPMWRGDIERN